MRMYRIRFGKQFNSPHWFTGFLKFRTIIEQINYSQFNWWRAKNLKVAERMLSQIREHFLNCALMNGTKDISDQFWIEEYDQTIKPKD